MTVFSLFLALSLPPVYYGVPGVAMSYEPVVTYWADIYHVPHGLAMAMMLAESGADPLARSREWHKAKRRWVPGRVLARGLFQVSVQHEAEHVRKAGMTSWDWRNPSDSARVGLAYMASLMRYFGHVRPSVAAYNCGRSRSEAWWKGERALPAETVDYLRKVLG